MTGDRIRVRYDFPAASDESARRFAEDLAREQTVEIPQGVAGDDVEASVLGIVEDVAHVASNVRARERRWTATVAFPVAAAGERDLPQLLNLLFGNVSMMEGVRIGGIEWPDSLLASFRGPAFGVAGLRRLTGVEKRPLLAAALKPLGLSARELARRAAACALGGIDLVKDDHGLADQRWAPFRERVHLCQEQIERANRATGGRSVYAPNLTGPVDELSDRLEVLHESGCRAALVAPALLGLDVVRALADTSGLCLIAHPALAGALAGPERGFAPEILFGVLFRLAGADAVVFPNPGGRFPVTLETCLALETRLHAPLGRLAAVAPMFGGGIDAARLADWIPRYGPDTIYLVGGSLFRHADVEQAARKLVEIAGSASPRRA